MNIREQILAPLTQIRDRGQKLVQLNIELLKAELKEKGARYAGALALLVVAGVLALYALGFVLVTITVALSLVLPLWLSLLIVTVVLLLLVVVLAVVGRNRLKQAGTPAPERAVAEGQATVVMVKGKVEQSVSSSRSHWSRTRSPHRPPGQAPPHTPRWPVRPEAKTPATTPGREPERVAGTDTSTQTGRVEQT